MKCFATLGTRDTNPSLDRRLRWCLLLDLVQPETSAILLHADSLLPSGISPSAPHRSQTLGPLVPPGWIRPPGAESTIRLARKPALFHINNSVRLVGFVGKDAEVKTTKTQREFTVLSLATTASWKDKNGDGYIRRTEWHKLIAWGNLSTFAATLRKGAHLAVEGELRYREFVPKKQKKQKNGDNKVRVAEIHLWRIAKLDRAEKRDPDTPVPELGAESQDAPF